LRDLGELGLNGAQKLQSATVCGVNLLQQPHFLVYRELTQDYFGLMASTVTLGSVTLEQKRLNKLAQRYICIVKVSLCPL
jgi:hypothetical protein